jgi:hypothetical protein
MVLEKQDSGLKDMLELTSQQFLTALDQAASEINGMETFFPNKPPSVSPMSEEMQGKLIEKQKALLAFSALQQFRTAQLQPPDTLLEGLLKRFADAKISLRGQNVPTRYAKPVFTPPAEVKYLETLLANNRSIEFALAVLKYYSGRNMLAGKAKQNLLALVREPSFEWELKDSETGHHSAVLLGKILQEACRRGNDAFYADLRDTILELTEIRPVKTLSPLGIRLPNPSEDPMSGTALAKALLRQFTFEMKRHNIPADLLEPLTAKSLMLPPPKPVPPPKPEPPPTPAKPREPYTPRPYQPVNKQPPKKLSFWDAILDYFAWKRIKNK